MGRAIWSNCKPNNAELSVDSSNHDRLKFLIGYSEASEITGISITGATSAMADVVFKTKLAGTLYSKYKEEVTKFRGAYDFRLRNYGVEDKVQKVFYRLYDDGWRVEKIGMF